MGYKRSKRAGFTLIELLAVIVVLAIIMVISTSIVINVINSARQGAFRNSVYGIVRAADLEYSMLMLNNPTFEEIIFTYEQGNEVSNINGLKLNYKGERPTSGTIIINAEGQVSLSLYNGEWCAEKSYNDPIVTINNKSEMECYIPVSLPTIELIGDNPFYVEINTEYMDPGVIAKNSKGEIINDVLIKVNNIETDFIETKVLGTHEILYIVKEGTKQTELSRTVIVRDTISPNLTIPSNVTLKVEEVLNYDFMNGVEVSDNSLEEIIVTLSGNVASLPGDYTVTYSAQDSSGNKVEKTRYITVIDVGYPEITILGNNPTNINVGSAYIDSGATAIDDVDGNITSRIVTTGTVNVNIPGTYIITYTVSDNANNKTSVTRTVNVIDNVPPTVTFGTNGNSTYAKTRSTTVTVSDAHSNINASSLKYLWNTSTATPSEGSFISTFTNGGTISSPAGVTGSYYLWILVKDAVGNTRIQRSNVFNLDNTVPVISGITTGTSNITSSGFTITRSGNATDAHSGLATNPYIYQISTNGSTWTTKCTNNTTGCAVTGLSATTNYYYRICVNDLLDNQSCVVSKTVSTIVPQYYYDKYNTTTQQKPIYLGNKSAYYSGTRTFYTSVKLGDNGWLENAGNAAVYTATRAITEGYRYDIRGSTTYYYLNYVIDSGYVNVDEYRYESVTVRGTLIQSNITAPKGTYPINGIHTDGYWYVEKSFAY